MNGKLLPLKRSRLMGAASRGHVRFQKTFKKWQLFKNLNDADIISMPMFATCKVKMEQNYFVYEKSQIDICFSATSFEVWWCLYLQRLELRWNTIFCSWKLWIGILKDNSTNCEVLTAVLWESRWENFVLVRVGEFFVHVTVTNVCDWLVKNLFCFQTSH